MTSKLLLPISKTREWPNNLAWALIGAVIGNLLVSPVEDAQDWVWEQLTHRREMLEHGKTLRSAAIEDGLTGNSRAATEKHAKANALFKQAEDAGLPEAQGHRAQAFCFGWSEPRDRRKGYGLILDAVKRDPRLAVAWLGNPNVCPPSD
jgi:TPR repeat protein